MGWLTSLITGSTIGNKVAVTKGNATSAQWRMELVICAGLGMLLQYPQCQIIRVKDRCNVVGTFGEKYKALSDLEKQMITALYALKCWQGRGAIKGAALAYFMDGKSGGWSTYRRKHMRYVEKLGWVNVMRHESFGGQVTYYYELTKSAHAAIAEWETIAKNGVNWYGASPTLIDISEVK